MRITIKNNPKSKITKEETKKATEQLIKEIVGEENLTGLKKVEVKYRKMRSGHGGKHVHKTHDHMNHQIILNSTYSKKEIYRVLAHEVTHLKQVFLKELSYKTMFNGSRRKVITLWKGTTILRSKYRTRAWEVEARKNEHLGEKIYFDTIRPKKESKITATVVIEKPKDKSVELTNKVLRAIGTGIKNGELASKVLEGNVSQQNRITVLKAIYEMKQFGLIKEKNIDGLIYVYNNG